MIVLHIGLPKTATTFLQYMIFSETSGITFVHRKSDEKSEDLCVGLKSFATARTRQVARYQPHIEARLLDYVEDPAFVESGGTLVVSDENVSVSSAPFWRGRGARPRRLARRLANLGRELRPSVTTLRVIIGIRRQDQWLASRYAESSKAFPEFSQEDFGRRITEICAARKLEGSFGWLDYNAVRRFFVEALGAENVLLVPMERLVRVPRDVLGEIGQFIGGVDLVGAYDRIEKNESELRLNRLSIGEDVWELRKDGTPLRLDAAVRATVLDRFEASNRALARIMPLDFAP